MEYTDLTSSEKQHYNLALVCWREEEAFALFTERGASRRTGGHCFCLWSDYIPTSHMFPGSPPSLWLSMKSGDAFVFCCPRHSACQTFAFALPAPLPGWIFIYALPWELSACRCRMCLSGDVTLSEPNRGAWLVCVHLGVVVCESCCTACTLVPIKHFSFDALSCGFQAAWLMRNPLLHAALAGLL